MPKPTHRQKYEVFLAQLRAARVRAGMTQEETAKRLGSTQTFVSKCERGERRLDVIDLIDFLDAFGANPADFVNELSSKLRPTGPAVSRAGRFGRMGG